MPTCLCNHSRAKFIPIDLRKLQLEFCDYTVEVQWHGRHLMLAHNLSHAPSHQFCGPPFGAHIWCPDATNISPLVNSYEDFM